MGDTRNKRPFGPISHLPSTSTEPPSFASTLQGGLEATWEIPLGALRSLARQKRDGFALSAEELQHLVWGATTGGIADEQLAAFLMAVFFRPADVRELTLRLGVEMLLAGEAPGVGNDPLLARMRLETALADGGALKRFAQLIEAQGGDPRVVEDPSRLPQPKLVREVRSDRGGLLVALDAEQVGLAAVELGAGRARKEDLVDHAAGLLLLKRVGDEVKNGDVLAELHAATEARLDAGEARLRRAVTLGDKPPDRKPLVLERVS